MSPDGVKKYAIRLRAELKGAKAKINRLYTKLEMYKDSVTIEKDDSVRDILQKALQHVGGTLKGEDSKRQIIELLVELETEGRITARPQEREEQTNG